MVEEVCKCSCADKTRGYFHPTVWTRCTMVVLETMSPTHTLDEHCRSQTQKRCVKQIDPMHPPPKPILMCAFLALAAPLVLTPCQPAEEVTRISLCQWTAWPSTAMGQTLPPHLILPPPKRAKPPPNPNILHEIMVRQTAKISKKGVGIPAVGRSWQRGRRTRTC